MTSYNLFSASVCALMFAVPLTAAPDTNAASSPIQGGARQVSPSLCHMIDQSVVVAHVVVTNVTPIEGNRSGYVPYDVACRVEDMFKGPTNEVSIVIRFQANAKRFTFNSRAKTGSHYLMFLKPLPHGKYGLTDYWLGLQPYDAGFAQAVGIMLRGPGAPAKTDSEPTESDVHVLIE